MNKKLINQIKKCLVEKIQPEKIFLFGSAVSQEKFDDEKSDIDLLIIKKTDLPYRKRYAQARASIRGFGMPFDLLIYNPKEIEKLQLDNYSVVNQAIKNGILLYEK